MSWRYDLLPSELGTLLLVADDAGLTEVRFPLGPTDPAADTHHDPAADPHHDPAADADHDLPAGAVHDPAALAGVRAELTGYLAGERRSFQLRTAASGTPFQRAVWDALATIPYGTTVAYRDVAARIGRPRAVRAVAQAIGRNPLAIVVPCHRVIGADGSLTGFSSGLERKRRLLTLEGTLPGGRG